MEESEINPLAPVNSKLPWWVRVIFVLGFPTAVSIFLLAVVTGFIESPLTKNSELRAKEHTEIMAEIRSARWNQIAVLRIICVQGAKSEDGRRDCLSVGIDGRDNTVRR